jgi:hypothetical protein
MPHTQGDWNTHGDFSPLADAIMAIIVGGIVIGLWVAFIGALLIHYL